jgi:hypothetical protein
MWGILATMGKAALGRPIQLRIRTGRRLHVAWSEWTSAAHTYIVFSQSEFDGEQSTTGWSNRNID